MQYVIKTTNKCNLDCIYCHEKRRMRGRLSILDADSMEHLLLEIRSYQKMTEDRVVKLEFTGGETLTIPHSTWEIFFRSVDKHLSDFNVTITIQTNLFSLSKKMEKLIVERRIKISTSYDFCPRTRVTLKGKPSEKVVMRNLNRLIKAGVDCGIITVISKYNIADIEFIYDQLMEAGVDFLFLPFHFAPFKYQKRYCVSATEYAEKLYLLMEKFILNPKAENHFVNAVSFSNTLFQRHEENILCTNASRCGESFIAIDALGNAYICPNFEYKDFLLGNVFDEGLPAIMSPDNPIKKRFARRIERRLSNNRPCRTCALTSICNSGCPYEALQEGHFEERCRFTCTVNKVIFPHLTKLYKKFGYKVPATVKN